MNLMDVQKMGKEAATKLKEHLGPSGVVIILMAKTDGDGSGVVTARNGDLLRQLAVLDVGGDMLAHDIRKAMDIVHVPKR